MAWPELPLFLITGAPGVGKSVTAEALMRRFPFGLHIPVDDLREWVVSGIASPFRSSPRRPARQFRSGAQRGGRRSRRSMRMRALRWRLTM